MEQPRSFRLSQGSSVALLVFTATFGVSGALAGPLRDVIDAEWFTLLQVLCVIAFAGVTASSLAVTQCAVTLAAYLRHDQARRWGFRFACASAGLCALVSAWSVDLGVGVLTGHPGQPLSQAMVYAAGAGLAFVKMAMFFAIADAKALDESERAARAAEDERRQAEDARQRREHSLALATVAAGKEPAVATVASVEALPSPPPRSTKPKPARRPVAARKPRGRSALKAAANAALALGGVGAMAAPALAQEPVAIEQPAQRAPQARTPSWAELDRAEAALIAKGLKPSQRLVADFLQVRRSDVRKALALGPPSD
ncbi:MAG: hypothetical protein NW206_19805 [Hyphomonadaceae bacterium]|nr:hypothetical protein [Hyphomonadaceae bacterium]